MRACEKGLAQAPPHPDQGALIRHSAPRHTLIGAGCCPSASAQHPLLKRALGHNVEFSAQTFWHMTSYLCPSPARSSLLCSQLLLQHNRNSRSEHGEKLH